MGVHDGPEYAFDSEGKRTEVIVDFLENIHGLKDKELTRGFDTIVLEEDFQPRLLTPALCLKSRYHNLHSLPYGPKRIDREVVRSRLAANATRYYLNDLLESPGNQRKALNWANTILHLAASTTGIQISVKHDLEPLAAIPERHGGFGDKFATGHYAAMFQKIMEKRESYKKRLAD